jgi:hypothetical protein
MNRQRSVFRRRGPVREPYDVVLLVCEGSKTEPNYLEGLRIAYRLSNVNIRVVPPPKNDPLSIVIFAIKQMEEDREFDRGYCIFDRDQHSNYDEAIGALEISNFGREGKLSAITSIPCFEVWLILHYRYSSGAYDNSGGESACARVIRDFRRHFGPYEKGHKAIFAAMAPRLDQAIQHAARLEKHNWATASFNPSTKMHHLVDYLTKLKGAQ